MSDLKSFLSTPDPVSQSVSSAGDKFLGAASASLSTPAPTPAAPSPDIASNTIIVLLVLVIVLLVAAVILLARSSIRYRKANAQNTVPASPETNKFLSNSFDTASVESTSGNPASVFLLSPDDVDKRKTLELRDAKRKVRRAFIRAMVAPTLLNLIFYLFISTDFFIENYIVTTHEYREIYGYTDPSFWGDVFGLVYPILNICLLFAWLPFVLRLFSRRNEYRNLAGKSDGFIRNALYVIGVCLLACAINFIGRVIFGLYVIDIWSA